MMTTHLGINKLVVPLKCLNYNSFNITFVFFSSTDHFPNLSVFFFCSLCVLKMLLHAASEPNLLKIRLKQRMFDRRNNPIARPKERFGNRVSKLASTVPFYQ